MTVASGSMLAYQQRVEQVLERVLPGVDVLPHRLHEAMRYVVLDGGKRMRPLLVYASGEALGVPVQLLDIPAAAVELIHVYSLVHDDLPAMDDDDLRRGKPSCHRQYDEATAILVGDALQALAFELLAEATESNLSAAQRLRMIRELGAAAGSRGMVGGQAMDLAAVGQRLSEQSLEVMHSHKTGALIRSAVLLGAYCSPEQDERRLQQLDIFAQRLGLAFQVQDDILDVESDTLTLGKQSGADAAADKPTYPSIMGLASAKQKLVNLHQDAVRSLDGLKAPLLLEIADFTVNRLH